MDDFDIYGDLEKYESEAKKDSEEVQDLLRRITELEKQLESKEQEKCDIEKKNRILAENISSLLLTAKAELKRKDTIIADLRKQCDNAAFRRGNQGPKMVASGKKREQATQTSVCHSRHTAVQTDLSKQEECSDRKRKAVRELNGDDETRESKRVRVHERGSSNRDLENDRERRREKSREREKDRYRDRDTDRLRCRDRARSRERVRERSRDRHKPRTSDRDREGMARRERDPIKESEANRKSELTDRKDRNLGGRGARSRPGNSSRDQQAKESVSSDHKSVPSNVERKSVSKDVGQSHRTERRTHSTKSNHAVDIRDSNDIVKAQTATSDKIPEESDPVVTILHSPGTVEQQNTIQKNTDETFPDTRNFGKFRNDSSPVAASTKCTTLDASEAAPQHKPNINEHLITQNNDTNAETCSIVSQSVTKDSIQQIPATHFRPNSVTIEPAIAEVAQQETCVEDTTNDQTTDYTPVPSREVTMVCASEDPNNSIDLPETMPTKASGDANESLKSPNQTVRPLSQEEGNGEEILESTSHTSNEKSTSKGDVIEHDSTVRSLADTIMVYKSPEAPIEIVAEKDHAMEGKQNDSNSYTVVEAEAAVDQIISYDQQQDAMAGLTESDLVLAENKHSAKLQLPKFKEATCNFIEWNDDILSSSKHLTKPVHPRIRALVKEAVAFKKALNNHKLATKLTEPIDLAEALVTHRRLPSNHGMCSTVQNYPSREAVIAARPEPLDGKLNNTTDNQLPPNNSHQVSGGGSNVNRQYEASSHCSSNFGNEFFKITSTCTISSSSSSSSMNRLPAGGRTGSVLSLQQIRGPSSTAVNVTVNELPSSEPQANASLPMMARSGPNYAVYTPWRNYFKDTNVENETIESNIKSPTTKRATSVEDQPVTTLNALNPTTNDETVPICSVATARASSAPMVDCSLKGDQLTEYSTSRTSSVVGHELLISKACPTTNDVTSDANSGTGNLAESCKQPTTALAGTINSKRRMSVDCLTEDKRPRTDLSSTTSRSASLSKEFFSPIALPIVSALDFVQPKPRCSTGAKTVCSTPKSKAPALPQTPPTPMVVLHSPAKSCRTPLKGPPMMESEFDANSSVQNIMDSLLKTPIKTEINDELEHDGNVPGIDESMFSNVSAISHDVLYKSYFCSENPLSAVKSDPEEEKTPVKQPCEAAMVDLVSPWHTAMSSTPVTATKSIPRIENTAEANVSAVTTDISSSNIFLSNSEHISLSNSMLEVCVDRDILPSESSQNVTNISSAGSKGAPEAVVRQRRRSSKKRKKKEKNSITDGHSRRSKRKKQQSNDTSSTTMEQTSASTTTLGPLPSGDEPREQFVPQPAQREYATGEIIPDKCDTIGNDTLLLQTNKATSEQQSTEKVNCRADVPNVAESTTGTPPKRVNFTTESANATKSIPSGVGNSSAPAVEPTVETATASGTTDKENVPWVKKESILRTPGQFVTPDGPVNFVREMRVVKESPNYMRVYITRKKV